MRAGALGMGILAFVLLPAFAGAVSPTIEGLGVRPNPFTPDGDGLTDSTVVSFVPTGSSDSLSVVVSVSSVDPDSLLTLLFPLATVASGETTHVAWAPGLLADGEYRFDIVASEGIDATMASAVVVADSSTPSLAFGSIGPNPFSPMSPPPDHELVIPCVVTSTDSSTASMILVRQAGTVVDTVAVQEGTGLFEVRWDGSLTLAATAPSGVYEIFAYVSDLAGNADSVSQFVTLDVTDPTLFADADTLQTDAFPDTLSGYALDNDRVAFVEVQRDSLSSFGAPDWTDGTADSVAWLVVVNDTTGIPFARDLVVRATDAVGLITEKTLRLAFDPILPVLDSLVVVTGEAGAGPGEDLTIRSWWNRDDLTLTVDFTTVDTGYLSGTETVTNEGGGAYLIQYTVTAANLQMAGSYPVVVTGSTGIVQGTGTVTLTLLDGPSADAPASIDCNRFDPGAAESVTITLPGGSGDLVVEVYNLAGRLVRRLEGTGSVSWDGTTNGGGVAASGVHIFRILGEEREEVRKVAVVRGAAL
ncbi:MAG: FlgD immunoglobulin-like domain containing protein [Gemmatimonadota bacterium]|jgi:hypothetical protein|nr:FlgD immunoglobulin-like domain containing protein [Gemmatimonadota bacterium]MDP6802290.1 FlgD immunoglobulin-like domain containing protein [Gemmatimonadota bacterium]